MKIELYLAIVGHYNFYWELLITKNMSGKIIFLIKCARKTRNISLLFDCQWLYSHTLKMDRIIGLAFAFCILRIYALLQELRCEFKCRNIS